MSQFKVIDNATGKEVFFIHAIDAHEALQLLDEKGEKRYSAPKGDKPEVVEEKQKPKKEEKQKPKKGEKEESSDDPEKAAE